MLNSTSLCAIESYPSLERSNAREWMVSCFKWPLATTVALWLMATLPNKWSKEDVSSLNFITNLGALYHSFILLPNQKAGATHFVLGKGRSWSKSHTTPLEKIGITVRTKSPHQAQIRVSSQEQGDQNKMWNENMMLICNFFSGVCISMKPKFQGW